MKRPALLITVLLVLISFCIIIYRIIWLKYPIYPYAKVKVWRLSIDARIKGNNKETKVIIGVPYNKPGQIVTEERIISGKFTFNLIKEDKNQVGTWTGVINGEESIGYQSIIYLDSSQVLKDKPSSLQPLPVEVSDKERILAKRLVENWIKLPPLTQLRRIAAAVSGIWGSPSPSEQDILEWLTFQDKHGRQVSSLVLLWALNLSARIVEGLKLEEGVTLAPLTWIEVWTGDGWERFQPETGEIYDKSFSLLQLTTNGIPSVRIINGEVSEIRWILNKHILSQWRIHFENILRSDRFLNRWSLFRIPEESQKIFRILLLVPISALIICVLRNIIGFPTFGIFMPVLMALAFRSTGLIFGLGIFSGVVLIGYIVRRWINSLRLLLVPRLSVLLTLVIISFTIFALIGNKLGFHEFMAVGLLPFVILTMTIERFFVIIEEAGVKEGLKTAGGSAAVAVITYEIIHFESLQLIFFVYPELLLVVGAFQILLGRYTGYRLSELIRFRKLRKPL